MKHTYYACPKPCVKLNCPICDGGLSHCTVCDCAEGTLTTECSGEVVPERSQKLIYDGVLDFVDGKWKFTDR